MKDISDIKKMSCLFCASRCGMVLHTCEGRLIKVEGDPESPVSHGWTCSTGRASMVDRYMGFLKAF